MADIEMMSDVLIGLIHGPQGGSARIIDQYYEEFERYEDEFPGQTKVHRQFSDTLSLIQRLFPNISDVPGPSYSPKNGVNASARRDFWQARAARQSRRAMTTQLPTVQILVGCFDEGLGSRRLRRDA
jgi:hypothetical protein